MGGSIAQIASYGAQDIFLTGNPQITFFKVVYRRYTNFAIQSMRQEFIGETNFGCEMSSVIDKAGDLMHKTYLEIELPEVDLVKCASDYDITYKTAQLKFDKVELYYKTFCEYVKTNTYIIRELRNLVITDNVSMEEIDMIMRNPDFVGPLENIRSQLYLCINDCDEIEELAINNKSICHNISRFDIQILYNSIYNENRCELKKLIDSQIYSEMQKLYLFIYDIYCKSNTVLSDWRKNCYSESYKFAWVEEIGNAIIDQIDVKIGPQVIDRHTGDWMIINNALILNEYQKHNYYKMIGYVPQLIKFDDCVKPRYKLIIPLLFWFCKYTGLALPLVALRYHDVMINLRLKELSQLCYIDGNCELPNIPIIQSKYNINIQNIVLYVDYIYLDNDERRRFAQSTHEYLIEVVQYDEFNIAPCNSATTHLTFSHPCRYMVFFCQPNHYRVNPTGRNKCQWNNFAVRPDKTGQPVQSAVIRLNSTEITDSSQPISYFNYVQPYLYFKHSPNTGQYVYSFSLNPMELQPNGTCNLSRIDGTNIEYKFTDKFVREVNSNIYECDGIVTGIFIATYVVSYNILRFISGMAGLAFQPQ